jgi:hypothetical protein
MKSLLVALLASTVVLTGFIKSEQKDEKAESGNKFRYRALVGNNPVKISWETLRDVTFKKKWYPEESVYMLYPTFGPNINKLNGARFSIYCLNYMLCCFFFSFQNRYSQ